MEVFTPKQCRMANVIYSLLKNGGDMEACVAETKCEIKTVKLWKRQDPEFSLGIQRILDYFNPVSITIGKDLEEANEVVKTACKALGLDHKWIVSSSDEKYMEAIQISVHIIRRRIMLPNEKKVSYKRLAYLLNRKQHWPIMNAEITCHDLLKVDKAYKAKYESVIKELDTEKTKTLNA